MDKKKQLMAAKICVSSCIMVNLVDMIVSQITFFNVSAIILGTISLICFILEEKERDC